ncbi:MAG: NAD(P)-dependent oxidoreductase [Polyangiales bacterium]
MARAPLRILSQFGDAETIKLPADLRDRVEVVHVPPSAPIPPDLTGDVLLMTFGNQAIYELAERGVKWVQFIGTGVNAFDVPRLAKGRVFTNSRGSVAVPISEWVVATLLHHEKRLDEIFIHDKPATWPVRTPLGTLYEKRVAILGLGVIGENVAKRLVPFGTRIVALRNTDKPSVVPEVELVKSVEALIDGADHLVIAAPSTPRTHHIVNAALLARAKPGLHLVNIARGDLVDQDALRDALDRGIVGAASLDTVTPEPLPEGHWLYTHPKVRLSPHISWSWPNAVDTISRFFVANLRRYLAGEPLENVIDPEVGY